MMMFNHHSRMLNDQSVHSVGENNKVSVQKEIRMNQKMFEKLEQNDRIEYLLEEQRCNSGLIELANNMLFYLIIISLGLANLNQYQSAINILKLTVIVYFVLTVLGCLINYQSYSKLDKKYESKLEVILKK